ncbi:hypothetical protein [Photobacterium leiognathi]|uniref:hypothetical protein n=1 Tax=Photobacterium leiognathi TaxID=553611 RepID=UPI00273A1C7A|nr:hypothetical protein [Photobacterium leiognathi]
MTAPAVGFVSDAGSQAYNATSNVGAFFSKDNLDDIAKNMPNISGEVSRIISSAEEAYNNVFGNDDNNKSNSGSTVNISNNGVPNFGENEKGITISDNGVPNFGSNNSSTKNIENATNTVNQDNGVDKNKDTNPTEEKTSNTDKPLNDKYNLQPQK